MNELSDGTLLLITGGIVFGIFYLIFLIDRRVKKDGALIKRDASPKSRFYALLIGVFIGSFTLLTWVIGYRLYVFILISMSLLAYGLGFDYLLEIFQSDKDKFSRDKIEGIKWLSIQELNMLVQIGGRFVVFEYCIPTILFSPRIHQSKVYFFKPNEGYLFRSIGYNIITVLLGWLSPRKLIQVLKTNFSGGKDITVEVMTYLEADSTTNSFTLS
ncbi:MAG: hypothetical protein AAF629_37050 [Chloroflexota bacterium]